MKGIFKRTETVVFLLLLLIAGAVGYIVYTNRKSKPVKNQNAPEVVKKEEDIVPEDEE